MFGIDMTVQELSLFMLFRRMVKQTFRTKRYEIAFFFIEDQSKKLEIFISICRVFTAEIKDIRKHVIPVILY